MTRLALFESFVTNLLLSERQQQQKTARDSFLDPIARSYLGEYLLARTYFGHFDEL